MAWRTAGRLGCGGGPAILFFQSRLSEAAGLQEGICDHRHEGMAMETGPGSPFKMVEAKLFLQLLMGLFANPARLDGGGDILDRRVCGQVREIIFALAAGAISYRITLNAVRPRSAIAEARK